MVVHLSSKIVNAIAHSVHTRTTVRHEQNPPRLQDPLKFANRTRLSLQCVPHSVLKNSLSMWLSLTLNKFMRSPEKAHQGLTIHKVLAQYKIKQILVNKAITVD